jgi:hypothetical protein
MPKTLCFQKAAHSKGLLPLCKMLRFTFLGTMGFSRQMTEINHSGEFFIAYPCTSKSHVSLSHFQRFILALEGTVMTMTNDSFGGLILRDWMPSFHDFGSAEY